MRKMMNRQKHFTLLIALTTLFMLLLMGCGGSKNTNLDMADGDAVNIDELLGIEEQAEKSDSVKSPEEAEVLRLLGIDEGASEANVASISESDKQNNESGGMLESEVQQLENQLSEKDNTINTLRQELATKEQQLQVMQTTPNQQVVERPMLSSGTSTYNNSFRSRYRTALDAYYARRYRDAIEQFSSLLSEDAGNSLSDNCQYWIGESYYGLGNFAQSIAEFEKVYSYPKSNKIDAAVLKLGLAYMRMGNNEQARAQFEQLIANYPNSEYVDDARSYLNKL